jgi:hypothetical protein
MLPVYTSGACRRDAARTYVLQGDEERAWLREGRQLIRRQYTNLILFKQFVDAERVVRLKDLCGITPRGDKESILTAGMALAEFGHIVHLQCGRFALVYTLETKARAFMIGLRMYIAHPYYTNIPICKAAIRAPLRRHE